MKNRCLLIALALIVMVNGVILVGVAVNRSGDTEATLMLSERELSYREQNRKQENTGVSLRLQWVEPSTEKPWFDEQKMLALGFDVAAIKKNRRDSYRFQRVLPKRGYLVLEYEGEAWRAYRTEREGEIAGLEAKVPRDENEKQRLVAKIARIKRTLQSRSRLFAIDVGPDPDLLRQKYPARDRYAVVEAKLSVAYLGGKDLQLHGRIDQLLIDRLHVPLALQGPFAELPLRDYRNAYDLSPDDPDWQSRYRVKVHWGGRYEPWIEEIVLATGTEKE